MTGLTIKEVAARTGLAAATIRVWEQRHGFPVPTRTASGYRVYGEDDVNALRRVAAERRRGLSVPAAIAKVTAAGAPPAPASLFATVSAAEHGARPQVLRKSTLLALSRAIEHETLARAETPLLFGAFQREQFYAPSRPLYQRLAQHADRAVVFADFERADRFADGPAEVPVPQTDRLGNEWAVIVDAPGFSACLVGWEQPATGAVSDGQRRFEAIWTLDPQVTRLGATAAAKLAGLADPELGEELDGLLADRPAALEDPAPALTALTNRTIAYLDR